MRFICLNKGLFVFIMVFKLFIGISQNDYTNIRKYWYFKSRLNNDFIKIGTGEGESIPLMQRGVNASTFNHNSQTNLKVGDGTSILGYYIAQLALEYYLLKSNNQNTDSTVYELTCALYAINRLDIKAEDKLGYSGGLLNGFFIRDDVPCNFVQNNYAHFNYYSNTSNNNASRGFASKFTFGMKNVDSSDLCKFRNPNSLISQDQVYNLLYGLSFVRKFIPNDLKAKDRNGNDFWFQDGQVYIREEAKAIAKRIIDNIRDPKKYDGSSCEGNTGTGWHIKNPLNCNQLSSGFNGHDLTMFSYPLAETECMINSIYVPIYNIVNIQNESYFSLISSPSRCSGLFDFPGTFHNTFSRTIGAGTWEGIPVSVFPNLNIDTKVFIGNLASICNCYYSLQVGTLYFNSTPNMLLDLVNKLVYSNVSPYVTLSPLYHPVISWYLLHHGSIGNTYKPLNILLLNSMLNTVRNLVNIAPCDNIYYLPSENPKYSNYEWSSDNRCDHPNRLGGAHQPFTGEYNGIDFMLFHNLWYSYKKISNNGSFFFSDLSHIFIDKNNQWYYGNISNSPSQVILYSKNNPIVINSFETVIIQKTEFPIFKDSYIRAGKYIHLKPGTWLRPANYSDTCVECIASDNYPTFKSTMRLYVKAYSSACEVGSICDNCRFINNNDTLLPPENTYANFFHYIPSQSYSDFSTDNNDNELLNNIDKSKEFRIESLNDDITIYPNPASNLITIHSLTNKKVSIEIINPLSQVLKSYNDIELSNEYKISLENIPSGLYYMRIFDVENNVQNIYKINIIK